MQLKAWERSGLMPVRMAVNVSTLQFHQSTFVDTVKGALSDSGIAPALLEIELTENVLVRDHELAMRTLFRLERLGVRTALDDFGTGYSSLAYLQQLPIGTLKIDRSFIQSLTPPPFGFNPGFEEYSDSEAASGAASGASGSTHSRLELPLTRYLHGAAPIVEAIIAMARTLGKEVVGEGIETAHQRDYLRRLKVDTAQGYFFARPLSPLKAEELLRSATNKAAAEAKQHAEAEVHVAPQQPEQMAPAALQPVPRSGRDAADVALDNLLLWD